MIFVVHDVADGVFHAIIEDQVQFSLLCQVLNPYRNGVEGFVVQHADTATRINQNREGDRVKVIATLRSSGALFCGC